MNNRLISSLGNASQLPASAPGFGTTILLLLFIAFSFFYLLVINILGKIGLGQTGQVLMVVLVPVFIFFAVGFATRISGIAGMGSLEEFRRAGGAMGAISNAMAGTAEWFSLFFVIGIIAALTITNHDGMAISIGAFGGFAFVAIFVLPKLAQSTSASLPATISARMNGSGQKSLRLGIAIVVVFCAMLFLIAQIGAGSHVIILHFPMPVLWSSILLLVPVVFTLLAGGMRGLTLANILLIWVIGAAILLPAIWMSATITGNLIPQLSYGNGALQPLLQLEEQMVQTGTAPLDIKLVQGNFTNLSGLTNFLATMMCIMAGTAALPLLYQRIACTSRLSVRIRSLGWQMIFVAILVSTLPAFVVFMKFEIYRDLMGLPIDQLDSAMDWLANWAKFEKGHHALICGKPAIDLSAIVRACGGDPNYELMPTDLRFSPLMTLVGAGEISDMPSVYSAISFAGVLSASATTCGIALMSATNTVADEFIFFKGGDVEANTSSDLSATVARRLFVSRILIIVFSITGIWLAQIIPVPVTDFSLWALCLAAGAIFPALLAALWWKPANAQGGLASVAVGFLATLYLMISIEYGDDWIAQNGDEPIWLVPFGNAPLNAMNAAIVVIPIALVLILIVSSAKSIGQKLGIG